MCLHVLISEIPSFLSKRNCPISFFLFKIYWGRCYCVWVCFILVSFFLFPKIPIFLYQWNSLIFLFQICWGPWGGCFDFCGGFSLVSFFPFLSICSFYNLCVPFGITHVFQFTPVILFIFRFICLSASYEIAPFPVQIYSKSYFNFWVCLGFILFSSFPISMHSQHLYVLYFISPCFLVESVCQNGAFVFLSYNQLSILSSGLPNRAKKSTWVFLFITRSLHYPMLYQDEEMHLVLT